MSAYLLISQFDSYVFNKGIRYSATVCPNGGPSLAPMNIAAPTLAAPYNVYKSALGEVWMYLDNTWRVIAGSYFLSNTYPDLVPDYTATSLGSFTAHRAGTVMATLHGYISVPTNAPIQAHELTLGVLLNGVFFNAHRHEQSAGNASDVVGAIVAALPVSAGDVITFFVEKVSLWDASLLQSVVTYKD